MLNSNSTGLVSPALRVGVLARPTLSEGQDPSIARSRMRYGVNRHLRDTPSRLMMSNIKPYTIDFLFSNLSLREPISSTQMSSTQTSIDSIFVPRTPQTDLRLLMNIFRKRKRAGSRSKSGSSRPPPRIGALVIGGPRELTPHISFNRHDRAFSTFWKEKIKVHPGDNRRHIPLVAVMKTMLQDTFGLAKSQGKETELESYFDQFICGMQGVEKATLGGVDLESKAKKVLGLLANLRSHIFLGHGHVNQVMGGLSDLLAQSEQTTLIDIDQAGSVESLELYLDRWSHHFQHKIKRRLDDSDTIVGHYDLRHFDRPTIVHYYMRQFAEITACLTADNFPELQDFKQQARSLVKNVRDSYATDISGAGHDRVRQWQNEYWLSCHKNMLNLVDNPDVEGVAQVLIQVTSLEEAFGTLVSSILNEQGLNTTPDMFHMRNKSYLNSIAAEPIRVALMALLQEPSTIELF